MPRRNVSNFQIIIGIVFGFCEGEYEGFNMTEIFKSRTNFFPTKNIVYTS